MIGGYTYSELGHGLIAGEQPSSRSAPVELQTAIDGRCSLEEQVRQATWQGWVEGIILRFGAFYGHEVASTRFWASCWGVACFRCQAEAAIACRACMSMTLPSRLWLRWSTTSGRGLQRRR